MIIVWLFFGIPLCLLLLEPAYHILKAKGYSIRAVLSPFAAVFAVSVTVANVFPAAYLVAIVSSAGLWLTAKGLPYREGCPGEGYLKFETVRTPPCLFSDQQLRQRITLDGLGVQYGCPGFIVSHVLPPAAWATGGLRLLIPSRHYRQAVQALSPAPASLELPDSFVPPPAETEIVETDGVAQATLVVLAQTTLIFAAWQRLAPALQWEPGDFGGALRVAAAMGILTFVLVMRSCRCRPALGKSRLHGIRDD